MKVFALLSVVVVIARPGVRATLVDLVTSTFDTEAYRGKSYAYRKMLWPVAMELAASSPVRFLFGHGGLSTETMDLSDKFDGVGGSTYHTGFSSWDNHYAADLVEFGYVGLLLQWVMFGYILFKIGRAAYRSPPETRDRNAAVVAALAVFMFSLTNVYMFSPQLKCMFWTLIVIGTRFTSAEWEDKMTGAEEQSSEEAEPVDENQGYAATV